MERIAGLEPSCFQKDPAASSPPLTLRWAPCQGHLLHGECRRSCEDLGERHQTQSLQDGRFPPTPKGKSSVKIRAQWIKVFDNLSLIDRTHTMNELTPTSCPLTCTCADTQCNFKIATRIPISPAVNLISPRQSDCGFYGNSN